MATTILSLFELWNRENSVRNLASNMKKSSFSFGIPGLSIEAGLPFTYGSSLLEQFIGTKFPTQVSGLESIPLAANYNSSVGSIGKSRVEELTRFKAGEVLKDIRAVPNDYGQSYPHSTFYKHNHYAQDLNSTTWKGLSQLLMQSDEYVNARGLFQNRLVSHINSRGGTLWDSFYTDNPSNQTNGYPNIIPWMNKRWNTKEGKQGNSFGENGPAFTVASLDYDLLPWGDVNTEDRDLGLFFGQTDPGLAYIKKLSYYDVGNGNLFYTADVEFYWFDTFNFDVKDRVNPIPFIRDSFDLQQYGWASPFTTSIQVKDTISGYMPRSQQGFWSQFNSTNNIFQPANGIANSQKDDSLIGTSSNDGLIGRSGNDILVGRGGDDILSGGKGADVFFIVKQGYDQIIDFNGSEKDIIRISASDFGGGLTPNTLLKAEQLRIVSGSTQASTASHRFIYNTTDGSLWFDIDGIGNRFTAIPIAGLGNKASLSASNISIVA